MDVAPETRIALLERTAIDMGEIVRDHEKRIRSSERLLMYGLGVVGLGSFVIDAYIHLRGN